MCDGKVTIGWQSRSVRGRQSLNSKELGALKEQSGENEEAALRSKGGDPAHGL